MGGSGIAVGHTQNAQTVGKYLHAALERGLAAEPLPPPLALLINLCFCRELLPLFAPLLLPMEFYNHCCSLYH